MNLQKSCFLCSYYFGSKVNLLKYIFLDLAWKKRKKKRRVRNSRGIKRAAMFWNGSAAKTANLVFVMGPPIIDLKLVLMFAMFTEV